MNITDQYIDQYIEFLRDCVICARAGEKWAEAMLSMVRTHIRHTLIEALDQMNIDGAVKLLALWLALEAAAAEMGWWCHDQEAKGDQRRRDQ